MDPRRHCNKIALVSRFIRTKSYLPPGSAQTQIPRRIQMEQDDFTNALYCHSRLYFLADQYDIPALRDLTIHHLHGVLQIIDLYQSNIVAILRLTRDIFENTMPQDRARRMVLDYCACIIEDIELRSPEMMAVLVDEVADFGHELIRGMVNNRLGHC